MRQIEQPNNQWFNTTIANKTTVSTHLSSTLTPTAQKRPFSITYHIIYMSNVEFSHLHTIAYVPKEDYKKHYKSPTLLLT